MMAKSRDIPDDYYCNLSDLELLAYAGLGDDGDEE
jgi:hypothetical protein